MLYINGQELKITEQQVKIGKLTNNGIKGYNINMQLKFNKNNKNGYLKLSAGFEKNNDIINFINKEYIGIPFDDNNNLILFEVYDTEKFLDIEIESEIIIRLKNIAGNKVGVSFKVNDRLINIVFDGYLDIV